MFELWVPITLTAAFLQCLRTALQKRLAARLSTNATTFARYLYGFPLAFVYVGLLLAVTGQELPALNAGFALYCLVGGVAQILATSLLIHLFALRNFAVGTIYSKTEVMQTALFGIVILAESVSVGGLLAIVVSMGGVVLLSMVGQSADGTRLRAWDHRAAVIGLLSGGCFAVASVSVRGAALSLEGDDIILSAALVLACMNFLQTLLLAIYLGWRERAQLVAVVADWRAPALIGITSVLGSGCWFTALALQNAAYVRILGQTELVFTFLASHLFFRERSRPSEIAGVVLIVLGVVLLLWLR